MQESQELACPWALLLCTVGTRSNTLFCSFLVTVLSFLQPGSRQLTPKREKKENAEFLLVCLFQLSAKDYVIMPLSPVALILFPFVLFSRQDPQPLPGCWRTLSEATGGMEVSYNLRASSQCFLHVATPTSLVSSIQLIKEIAQGWPQSCMLWASEQK